MCIVQSGLERFLAAGSDLAGLRRGARIGLVAHPASVDRELRHAVDLIRAAPSLRVVRLFAPEHGVRGQAQDMEAVGDARDRDSGLEVLSLYGSSAESLRPGADRLDGLDAVLYDLQDIGSRYYTFVYTLSYVMEAAAEAEVPVVVLDRPNPIGGRSVGGPVLDTEMASFVGRYPIPVRHGMTTAELAVLFNERFGIGCDLRIVPMAGWRRRMWFDDTGLPWVPPSPNMPTLDTAAVYPGGCLVEGTNLSEGRGTTRPFETIGAPWIDATAWAEAIRRDDLPGVGLRVTEFRPMFQKHAGKRCFGLFVHVTARDELRPFETYLVLICEARRQDPGAFAWRTETYEFESERLAIDLLLGRSDIRPMIESGASLGDMESTWARGLARFEAERQRFLMYPD